MEKTLTQKRLEEINEFAQCNNLTLIELHGVNEKTLKCLCNKGELCTTAGKHPKMKSWQESSKKDVAQFSISCNVGFLCGKELIVIDIDERNGGLESLQLMQQAFGKLPPTVTVKTGNGLHFYYKHHSNFKSFKPKQFKGIDIQAKGAYVVCPPSLHQSGKNYSFEDPDAEISMLPEFILDLMPVANVESINTSKEPENYSHDEIIEALSFIDPNCSYNLWWKIGAALYNSGLSFEQFDSWSKGSKAKYNEQATKDKWDSFTRKTPDNISCGTIIFQAKIEGWKPKISLENVTLEFNCKDEEIEQRNLDKYNISSPELPKGITGEIAQWIYNTAPYQDYNFAIQAALSVAAMISQGIHRTNYFHGKISSLCIMVAGAGQGKNHYTERCKQIINAIDDKICIGLPQSKQALHMDLLECNNRCMVQSESMSFIKKMCNPKNQFMNSILDTFLVAWDNSEFIDGLRAKKESNSIPKIPEAHLSLLGGGVTEDLCELINNPEFISSGLASRLDFIFPIELTKNKNAIASFDIKDIQHIVGILKSIRLQGVYNKHLDMNFDNSNDDIQKRWYTATSNILVKGVTLELFNNFEAKIQTMFEEIVAELPQKAHGNIGSIFSRTKEKVLRTASSITAIDCWNYGEKTIKEETLNWVINWHTYHLLQLVDCIFGEIKVIKSIDLSEFLEKTILNYAKKHKKTKFHYRDIYNSHRKVLSSYGKFEVEQALFDLQNKSGILKIDKPRNDSFSIQVFKNLKTE